MFIAPYCPAPCLVLPSPLGKVFPMCHGRDQDSRDLEILAAFLPSQKCHLCEWRLSGKHITSRLIFPNISQHGPLKPESGKYFPFWIIPVDDNPSPAVWFLGKNFAWYRKKNANFYWYKISLFCLYSCRSWILTQFV